MPERGLVRKGNRQYNRADYKGSVDSYSRALQHDPNSFEAKFNTANVQYRMAFQDTTTVNNQMLSKAENTLRKLAQDSTRTDIERGDVQYNLGNTLFAQQKLQDALDCYRNAMRFNPDDKEAKFNYALTKELLKQQQNQQNQQQQNQNQDNQNQDQNQQQQPENQDDKQDNQDQQNNQNEQDNQDQNQDQQDEQQQPSEPQISEQEQQAMLEAIQAQEDKTQEKLKEKKGVLIRGGKNW
ncbi:MAG: tetratricopeptide repeat protein [Alistipes sp.]|nr:tetratricopeptide repeat protein [Alistipes sp.]